MTVNATLRDIGGLRVGHTTHEHERTGCTVIAFDAPALTAVEVRGAAPGTRELDLLAPGRTVQRADAILLTGGSAFGLRAADGVMQSLAAAGRGFPTPTLAVPIVPAAVIYDLGAGEPRIPSAEDGAHAWHAATPLSRMATGRVGAGTGARWGAITGTARDGGFTAAQIDVPGGTVTAFAVLNAYGALATDDDPRPTMLEVAVPAPFGQSTTLMAVIVDIPCDHQTLTRLCVAAHDALARVIRPAHTHVDGDVAFASTTAAGAGADQARLRLTVATELAMEAALRRAAGVEH